MSCIAFFVAVMAMLSVAHFATTPRGLAPSTVDIPGASPTIDTCQHQAEKPLVCGILSPTQVQGRPASSQGESCEDLPEILQSKSAHGGNSVHGGLVKGEV